METKHKASFAKCPRESPVKNIQSASAVVCERKTWDERGGSGVGSRDGGEGEGKGEGRGGEGRGGGGGGGVEPDFRFDQTDQRKRILGETGNLGFGWERLSSSESTQGRQTESVLPWGRVQNQRMYVCVCVCVCV